MAQSVCIISGLDPSGGAGFIADVRVVGEHGLRPVGVVTALTEQDTGGVRRVEPVPVEVLSDQLRALLADIEVSAVKIGMLGSEEVAEAVAAALELTGAPVVWDPVLRPTRGRAHLYRGDPARARALLDPHVSVLTPNAAEAEALLGEPVRTRDEMRDAAARLCGDGQAVLVTGGDLESNGGADGDANGGEALDVLVVGGSTRELRAGRIATASPIHGTGCVLSTALACGLARGMSVADAAVAAKTFVTTRMRDPVTPGRGMSSLL